MVAESAGTSRSATRSASSGFHLQLILEPYTLWTLLTVPAVRVVLGSKQRSEGVVRLMHGRTAVSKDL